MSSINIEKVGQIPYALSPESQFQMSIDISTWLGTDTIGSVAYTAEDEDDTDVTSAVIVLLSCSNTSTVIRPYIKGGSNNKIYKVKCLVTTTGGDKEAWYIKWSCLE